MAQQEFNINVSVTLKYDEESELFKEALDSYQSVIYSNGEAQDMLNYVAYSVAKYGCSHMVEGVGYVRDEYGFISDSSNDSGIQATDISHD